MFRTVLALLVSISCVSHVAAHDPSDAARVNHDSIVSRQIVRAELLDGGWVRGTVRIDVRARDAIRVWMYPDRLAVAPSALNQQNARWTFPREEDLSEMRLRMKVDGRDVEPVWEREPVGSDRGRDYRGGDLRIALPAGDRHVVQIGFVYRLPERFGRLGRVGDRLTLTAPWYPVVIAPDGGARLDVVHDVELTVPEGSNVALPHGSTRSTRDGNVVRVTRRGAFVPVVVASRLRRWRRSLRRGYTLEVVANESLYQAPEPDARGIEAIHDIMRVDVLGQIERVANDAIQTLTLAEVPSQPRLLRVVLTPSRTEMAATAPGMIVVSDRIYEIFPLDQVRAFHDRALRRAMFQTVLESRVDSLEAPADRHWSEDLRAVILSDLDDVRRQGGVQSAQDLIGWAGFHPAIDQLLYAPQVSFVDVYFGTVDEPDPFRDHPGRSRDPTSRGRRILESARDVLSEDQLRDWSRRLIRGDSSARDALDQVAPDVAGRLDDWLRAPSTAVNYRLGEVTSTRTDEGWSHRIHVHRDGDDRLEPVEVAVVDRDGNVARATWDGEGDEGIVVLETPSTLRDVNVDPRARLVQSSRVADGHPRRDDTWRLPWRPPLLQAFNLAGSSEGVITGFIDFALQRRYDLENSVSLRIATGARSIGGLLRYRRGIGRKRDNNARIGFVTPGIGVDRLRSRFADDRIGGVRVSAVLSAGFSTQRYFLDPRKGSILIASVRGSLVRRDGGNVTYTLAPSLRANLTLASGLRGATVLVGGFNWVFGDPLDTERPGLGGRFLLRAYQTNEAVGRGRAFAVIEQRFTPTFLSDLNWNLFHIAWVREIQLALFAGAGAVFFEPGDEGRDVVPGVEVGGGIRVHFEWGGIQPGVLSLDWAVPLIRESTLRQTLPPLTFIFGFEQFF